jgi:hypothetical protein
MENPGMQDKENTRLVPVTNRPTNKVWMGLRAESGLDYVRHAQKGRRVGGMLESMEDGAAITLGQVELARSIGSQILADYTIDLGTEWLNGNWVRAMLALCAVPPLIKLYLQGCHLSPAWAFASSTDSATVRVEYVPPDTKEWPSKDPGTAGALMLPIFSSLSMSSATFLSVVDFGLGSRSVLLADA